MPHRHLSMFPVPALVRWNVCWVALSLALLANSASAQAHVKTDGQYTLRASTVRADVLPVEQRRAYGIPLGGDAAVLNVTVQRKNGTGLTNARAQVRASQRDLAGVTFPIDMREVLENGFVSYLGVYSPLAARPLGLEIEVEPEGSGRTISMSFEEWFGR